jgi:hypothetical protein
MWLAVLDAGEDIGWAATHPWSLRVSTASLKIVISWRWVLRATTFEMRLEAASIFSDLRAMGVPTLAELSASQAAITS